MGGGGIEVHNEIYYAPMGGVEEHNEIHDVPLGRGQIFCN